ncbi:metal-dependent hydrolase [Halosegnis marinus]|uniref:Metal-dependent hydrolase n=1 Tax=Halosegnis marinus TaxID=3034023 RepID=A0ABD5ZQ75_9EURY|nr:metal-dependent hydrolase [Halosegnis sp. DT85]
MNKEGHVLNGVLLAIGLGYVLEPAGDVETFRTIAATLVPVTLGALFPDVDTAFGKHRKTLHNLPVLAIFLAYPIYFGNLQYVWVGVVTHYVLDIVGSKRGIALFYPLSTKEYGFPTGVTTSSKYANLVTVVVTVLELAVIAAFVHVAPGALDSIISSLPFDPAINATNTTAAFGQ